MSDAAANLHASAVDLGGKGVVIFGKSGSGKTSLALELVRQALRDGIAADLVADDRVIVRLQDGELIASPPENLKGLVEIRGSGIHKIACKSSSVLRLAVELVLEIDAQRMSPLTAKSVAFGIALPVLVLPENRIEGAIRAILSHLGLYFPVSSEKYPQ